MTNDRMTPNATAIGNRYIERYLAEPPTCTYAQLQQVLAKGLITQEEFDATVAQQPSPPHA